MHDSFRKLSQNQEPEMSLDFDPKEKEPVENLAISQRIKDASRKNLVKPRKKRTLAAQDFRVS